MLSVGSNDQKGSPCSKRCSHTVYTHSILFRAWLLITHPGSLFQVPGSRSFLLHLRASPSSVSECVGLFRAFPVCSRTCGHVQALRFSPNFYSENFTHTERWREREPPHPHHHPVWLCAGFLPLHSPCPLPFFLSSSRVLSSPFWLLCSFLSYFGRSIWWQPPQSLTLYTSGCGL